MENFKLLPARIIISVLKKMDSKAFCRAYRTCRDMKEIADRARAEIKIELKDNDGNGFGIDFSVYAYEATLNVRIYKPILSIYDNLVSLEPLYAASPWTEEDLNDIAKPLFFFKWEAVNIFPCGYYWYKNEETSSYPVIKYVDWIFKVLKANYFVCEQLKSPPSWHIKEALNYLRVKNWYLLDPGHYERKKVDWNAIGVASGVIEKNITFSLKLWCAYVDDLSSLLNLFCYLNVSIEDSMYTHLTALNKSLVALDQRLNYLRLFPRSQEVQYTIWSKLEYPYMQPQQFLNFPFTEYIVFVDATEIERRGLKWAPKILHIPTVDNSKHLMMVIFQGKRIKKWNYSSYYLKIYYIVVNDWQKCLKELPALFNAPDELLAADKHVNQFERDFFEL